jgi:hypothetical protein
VTARRDEVQTARDARREGQAQAAQIAADLSALPGWLLVGDPGRLDPAEKTTADHGAELLAQLGDTHNGLLALDEELDALDGARPRSIDLFLEWTSWLEQVPDAATLLAELVPDPRRLFLGAEPRMTEATAQRIVDTIAANGGRVGDGDTFVHNAALAEDDVFDLDHTALLRLDPVVAGQALGVLLPLRLETRFRRPDDGPWTLRVRVYPDPVALAPPAPTPTRHEADLVAGCWTQSGGDLTSVAGEAAFRSLAASVGGARAAYLLRTVEVVPQGAGYAATGDYREQGIRTDTYSAALPETLSLWGDVGNGLQLLGELHPDLAAIAAQADITGAMAGLEPDRVPELWWTSYEKALEVGLAVEVEIPDGPAGPPGPEGPQLSVLLVTGLGDQDPRALFERHADRGSLGVVAPMSPTNTVAGAPAADLGRDPAVWLAVAQDGGGGTFDGLAAPLTGSPLLEGVPGADLGLLDAVSPLVTALWPALWQRRLKDVENAGIDVVAAADWAARVLCPLGPYAALRVGDVPYGVLPAVDAQGWASSPNDPPWESTLLSILRDGLQAWAAAGAAGGTAAGADVDGLLEIIGRVPTARAPGSRLLLPLDLIALLRAAAFGENPLDVVHEWETDGAAVLSLSPEPLRRYQPFGYVQPAVRGREGVREALHRYLQMSWEELAHGGHEFPDRAPFLVRLLRHSLLLTQAEVSRLDPDHWPAWKPPYLLAPEAAPEQLAADASNGGRVDQLPDYAQQKLDEQYPPDPRVLAIVRQFGDVRQAIRLLAAMDDRLLEGGALAPGVAAVLDTSSHRIDPWITAVGTRRLRRLTARGVPRRLGAYGWVDDLSPAVDPTPPTTAGLLHAPGPAQALTAAVLRDHAVHDDDARWQITARSDLIRLAAALGADVRLGIHLSEALGREIERRAGDPASVLTLRRKFPPRPEQAGRRVCDGLQVLDADPGDLPAEVGPLDDLRHALDTYGDLLVADAVHDVVSGRGAQAQESMEAAAGLGAPPELRLLRTQRQGASVRTTVLVVLQMQEAAEAADGSPVALADPALAGLLDAEVGPASAWTWTREDTSVSLDDLGLGVPDVVLNPQALLDVHAGSLLGGPPTGGTAVERRQALDRLCSLIGAQRGLPAVAGDPGDAETELRTRLAALRAAAATTVAELGAAPPVTAGARRWGLPDDPAAAVEVLRARLDELGDPATDATADGAELSERIRTLLAPVSGLPVICTGVLPATVAAPDLDRDWLEIVAAVRPALARLEAHQLHRAWPAAATAPDRLWSVPEAGAQQVVVYGPGVGAPGPTAVALLDDWGETVPSTRHTTHAAFGFDAPRARAAQAILLALPPDEQVALSADALPGIVLSTRVQAHARMAQPDRLGAWSLAVPTSMVLAGGRAGSDLVGP